MMNLYERVGQQVVGEVLADAIGDPSFDWTTLVNAAAEAANQGIKYDEANKAKQKAGADSKAAAARSIAADAAWASAEAQLDLASHSGDASRAAPATALQMQAMANAMSAGAGLSSDAQALRVAAADKAASDAAQAALQSPQDALKQAMSRAWGKVLATAKSGGGGLGGGSIVPHKYGDGGNWFMRVHAGVPTYGWIIGGGVAATGLVLILRALFGHKRK